ncbi:MAG: lytic transglycosylase domain-containing protein, partial [Polaromonas sp.]
MTASGKTARGLRTFASDVAGGFFVITHRYFDLLGLAFVFAVINLPASPDPRQAGDEKPMDWPPPARHVAPLGEKVEAEIELAVEASDRVTAANPQNLSRPQAAVAHWLSNKYRVAPEPLSVLVAEAYDIGGRTRLDPTLILAIMAIES